MTNTDRILAQLALDLAASYPCCRHCIGNPDCDGIDEHITPCRTRACNPDDNDEFGSI
jgi:hypothetical protein